MSPTSSTRRGVSRKVYFRIGKTIRAWANWRNYAVETGDFAEARQYIAPSLKSEVSFYDEMSGLYQKGGWIIDGHNEFVSEENPQKVDDQTYLWKVYRKWNFVSTFSLTVAGKPARTEK